MTSPLETPLPSLFLPIPNVLNIRRVPLPSSSTSHLLRSGNIANLTASIAQEYSIRTIFDLRSKGDMKRFGIPLKELDGVDVEWAPMISEKGVDEKERDVGEKPDGEKDYLYAHSRMRASFAAFQADSVGAFMKYYMTFLQVGQESIGKVLRKIIQTDHDDAIIIHCSAGKDRTGVLTALILLLAEIPSSTIIDDYALTTLGFKLNWDMVMGQFENDPAFMENREGGLEMLSSHPKTMAAFLKTFQKAYGDPSISEPCDHDLFAAAEKYVVEAVGLTSAEVKEVKRRLKGDA